MNKQIVFTKVNTAELLETELRPLNDNEVKVKTLFHTMSNGTEKANITGEPNISIFAKGDAPVVFPRYCGYSSSGIVEEVGAGVKNLKVGDKVAMSWSKYSAHNILPSENVVKIEDERVSMEEASMAHIATFPMGAIRKTRLEMGESAMVMGLGILGLLAIGLLRAAGAVPVIAVDPVKERREKALRFGADYAFDPFDKDFAEKVKEVTHGGVKVCIEVTGIGAGLNGALDCMAKFGRVALLGCTRSSDFSVDYYHKVHGPGISLIGAHTMARPVNETSAGMFTTADDVRTVLELCAKGRLDLESIVDEIHSPTECAEVFDRLVNDKNFPNVVQFDWEEIHNA